MNEETLNDGTFDPSATPPATVDPSPSLGADKPADGADPAFQPTLRVDPHAAPDEGPQDPAPGEVPAGSSIPGVHAPSERQQGPAVHQSEVEDVRRVHDHVRHIGTENDPPVVD